MNERGRAAGSGTSSAVRSHVGLLVVLLAVITVRSPPVDGDEPPSFATRSRAAIAAPLLPFAPPPEAVLPPVPDAAHAKVFRCNPFPSAAASGECHPKHYREWSMSQYAYAQMSPVFNVMQGRLLQLSNGKLVKFFQLPHSGFCASCHEVSVPNGLRLEEAFGEWKTSPANKQGISCQDCHAGKEPGRILASRDDPDFEWKKFDFGPRLKGERIGIPAKLGFGKVCVDDLS